MAKTWLEPEIEAREYLDRVSQVAPELMKVVRERVPDLESRLAGGAVADLEMSNGIDVGRIFTFYLDGVRIASKEV